jgi:hypothetical protein
VTSYTQVFGGSTILPAFAQYQAISLTANTALSWPNENQSGTNVLAKTLDLTATGAFTLTLPDARLGSVGYTSVVYNLSASAIQVNNNIGGSIVSIPSSGIFMIYLRSNGTQAGTWGQVQLSTGPSAATAASLQGLGVLAIATTLNQSMPASILGTNYNVTSADRASALIWNGGSGTITLPAGAGLGTDFFLFVKGGGTGSVTVQPSGGELIDGQASISIGSTGSTAIVFKSGAWYTISFVQNPTLGYTRVVVDVAGSGNFTLTPSQFTNDLIYLQGVLSGNREVIFPATVGVYYVENATTGAFSLGVRTGSQSPAVTIAQGARSIVQCDGTNMGVASTQLGFPSFAGNANKFLRLNSGETAFEFASVGTIARSPRTSNTILAAGDLGNFIDVTSGTFTQTFTAAATLGSGWFVYYRNSGTGDVTLDPNLSETIDGLTSFVMYPGEARIIQCDGSAFRTILLETGSRTYTADGTFVVPPGISGIRAQIIGGGGGGAGGNTTAGSNGVGSAGGGGALREILVTPPAAGTSMTVTVGVGGTAGSAGGAGGAGGTSTFAGFSAGGGGAGARGGSGGGGGWASVGGNGSVGTNADGGTPNFNLGGAVLSGTVAGVTGTFGGGGAASSGNAEYGGGGGQAGGSLYGGGGGGPGGSLGNAGNAAGRCGFYSSGSGSAGGAGGGAGSNGTAGSDADPAAGRLSGGGGGGGGGGNVSTGGNGAAGGTPGGGGGGGGGCTTGTSNGGAGGRGEIRIWWW